MADQELKKAFQELQTKMLDAKQKMRIADIQIEMHKSDIKRAHLTNKELAQLPINTKTYKPVGRMFVLQTVNESLDSMKTQIQGSEEKIEKLTAQKCLLERNMKESEDHLREMIQAKKASS